jgi:putative peptidoglycan lipid II flippase
MFKTLFSLSGLSILGHFIALASQIVLSRTYGTGLEMDLFYYALTLITTFSFFTAPISEAAVPQLYSKSLVNKKSESEYFSKVINLVFILGAIMSVVVLFALEYFPKLLIEESLLGEIATIRMLCLSLLPLIFLTMLTGFNHAALNSYSKYVFQQITRTVGAVLGLILMYFLLPVFGVKILIATTLMPIFILLVGQYLDFKKLDLKYRPSTGIVDNLKFYKVFIALSGTFLFYSIYLIFEKWVLADLGTGMVSAYTYAQKLSLVPQLIFVSSILTVTNTRVLEKLHKSTHDIAVFDALNIAAACFGLCLFLGAGLSVYSREIIYIFFFGGAFGAASLELTSKVFQIMILALPFIVLYAILNRIIAGQQKAKMLGMMGIFQSFFLFIGAIWAQRSGDVQILALFNIVSNGGLAVILLVYLRLIHGKGIFRFFVRKSYILVLYSGICFLINHQIQKQLISVTDRLGLIAMLSFVLILFSLPILFYLRRILATFNKVAPESVDPSA